MIKFWLPAATLWRREMVRFYRQPSRIVGALGSPIIFWLLIGSGIGTSFQTGSRGMNYLKYFFPGSLLLVLLFTAIFSTISLIEDRREGFFQSVLVAPVPRSSIVLGKILGGSSLAFFQGVLFLFFAPLIGIKLGISGWFWVAVVLFANAFALTALGFVIAWQFQSVQGFHAIMNLFLVPLWLLSGALFPAAGAMGWVRMVMKFNPLTYGMISIDLSLFSETGGVPSTAFAVSMAVTLGFGAVLFLVACAMAARPQGSPPG